MRLHVAIAIALVVACSDRAEDSGVCHDGDRMLSQDLCNECGCSHGAWGWTEIGCADVLEPGIPVCYSLGLADADPETSGVQLQCAAISELPKPTGGAVETLVAECTRTPTGFDLPSPEIDACWFGRTDATHTGDPIDDVSAECVERRGDLLAAEIDVLLRPNTDAEQASYKISCTWPEPMCPGPDLATSG